MQQIVEYATTYGSSVASCSDLSMVIPNVPGYDTDNPITPSSPYNLPSYCSMWNEARSGNLGFLPPASLLPDGGDLPLFNWMIKRNIGSISNPNPTNGQSYIIYFPNQAQINADPLYKNDLIDAIQFQIDFAVGQATTFPFITNYGNVSLPVEIVQTNNIYPGTINKPIATPSCYFQYPPEVDEHSVLGGGRMVMQLRSTLTSQYVQLDGISNEVSNIQVSLTCTSVTNSGKGNTTATITVVAPTSIEVPPLGVNEISDIIAFNMTAAYHDDYPKIAIPGALIATCDVHVVYNMQDDTRGSFDETFQCKVSSSLDNIDMTPDQCAFVDMKCQKPLWKSGMFWICVVSFLILLVIIGVLIWQAVKQKRKADEVEALKEERMDIQRQKQRLITREEIELRDKDVSRYASFVDE